MRTTMIRLATLVLLTAAAGCQSNTEAKKAPATLKPALPTAAAQLAKSTVATAPPPFEGLIRLDATDPAGRQTESMQYDIKGTRVHYTETKEKKPVPVQAIADLNAHKAYAILDSRKAYVELDKAVVPAKTDPVTVTKLGKSETIAGLPCEDWKLSEGKRQVDVCATRAIPYFDLAARPRAGEEQPAWAATLEKENVFPLRIVEHDDTGKVALNATASWVDRKHEDDSLFQVPKGYHRIELPRRANLPGLP